MADALVKLLNAHGYQPVFLPRTGVVPPELYNFAEHRLIRRGPLDRYFGGPVTFPEKTGRLGDLAGQVTSGKDFGAAIGFLKNALASLGIASLPRADLSFAGSKTFVFTFSDVTYRSVDPADLDVVIQDVKLPLAVPDAYVEHGALHIAFEYAYARTLTMRRADGQKFASDVSGGIGEWVDVGAKANVEVQNNAEVSFSSADGEVAAFAYKAGRLQRAGDRWVFEPEVVRRRAAGGTPSGWVPAPRVVLVAEEP